jgi:HD superfamily phosphodiesterase
MSTDILENARNFLVNSLKGKYNGFETKHPWRKDWEFAVLHSLRVESYTLKILARENHLLSEPEIILLRLAAILHDIARLDKRENHAKFGAEIAEKWFQNNSGFSLTNSAIEKVLEMIADHSNKGVHEHDFSKAVLKDADTLDEIGVMSIFMTTNWLENQTPFFFYNLRQRLIEFELPFCDEQLTILNTTGAKEILSEKKTFVENFITQITDELQADSDIEQILLGSSKNGG